MKKTKITLLNIVLFQSFIFPNNTPNTNVPLNTQPTDSSYINSLKIQEGQKFSSEFRKLALEHAPEVINRFIQCAKNKNCPEKARPKRIWIHGPSGSGKTTIAQVFADELGLKCKVIQASLLANEYVNSFSENFARNILPFLDQPCVIVIDEMDFAVKASGNPNDPHQSLPQQLWQILDYLKTLPHVIVIGTSNTINNIPEQIETRFAGTRIYMGSSDSIIFRKEIFRSSFKDMVHELDDTFFKQLAEKTKDLSLRELEKIVEISAAISFGRGKAPFLISKSDVNAAVEEFKKDKSAAKKANAKPMIDETFVDGAKRGAGIATGGIAVAYAFDALCKFKGWDCSFMTQKK